LEPDTEHGYHYEGDIGNGFYKLMIGGRSVDVFCDMDLGGWMYLIVDGRNLMYLKNFADTDLIESSAYFDEVRGIGWGTNDSMLGLGFYNIPFSSVKMKVSANHNNPTSGTGYMNVATGANGAIIDFTDSDTSGDVGQSIIVDGSVILENDKTDLILYDVQYDGNNDGQNNLVI
jgi:hypothetical protein